MSYQYPERKSQPGSAERNAQPIVAIVAPMLQKLAAARRREDAAASPDTGKSNALPPVHVLEVGSGEGVQLAALAQSLARMPVLFQPTEVDAASCHDVDTHCGDLSNVARCATLDIQESSHWQSLHDQTSLSPSPSSAAERQLCCAPYDAVLVLNIVHIVPWETVQALFAGVSAVQSNSVLRREAGIVLLYGAFREHGSSTGEGNEKVRTRRAAGEREQGSTCSAIMSGTQC